METTVGCDGAWSVLPSSV